MSLVSRLTILVSGFVTSLRPPLSLSPYVSISQYHPTCTISAKEPETNQQLKAMHCHNDFHADTGMFMQIVENPAKLRQRLGIWDQDTTGTVPPSSCGLCQQPLISNSGAISRTSTVAGNIWGPWAQTVRTSMAYYGCPWDCYRYLDSNIPI